MSQSEDAASSSSSIQPSNASSSIYLSSQLNASNDCTMHNNYSPTSIYTTDYTMLNQASSREKLKCNSTNLSINNSPERSKSKSKNKKLEHQAKSCINSNAAHRAPLSKQKTIEVDCNMRDYLIDDKRDSIKSVTGNKFVLNDKDLIELITLRTSNIAIVVNSSSNLTINDIDKSSNELDQLPTDQRQTKNRQFLDVSDAAKRRRPHKNYSYCDPANLRNYKKNSSLTRSHSNNSIDLLNTSLSSLILKNPPSCKFNPSYNESKRQRRKKPEARSSLNETDDDDIIEPSSNCVSYLVRN